MHEVLIAFGAGLALGAAFFVVPHAIRARRARAAARAAARAWGDGACMQRPEDYNSGPPRPVPPERAT